MKRIKLALFLLILFPAALWLASDTGIWAASGFFAVRANLVQLTGILGMTVMSAAMLLAVRPAWIESLLQGLDKSYRLHKWLGISGLVLSLVHWLWAKGPKWAVGWGWLERPARRGSAGAPDGAFEQFLRDQRGLAEGIGEWAFYGAVVLIILALLKWFPYRYFYKTHRFIAVAYLLLVFHSVILMKPDYWGAAVGPFMGVLMIAGTIAAFISLLGRVGHKRRVAGYVDTLNYHEQNRVLTLGIQLTSGWTGHKTGQFAFVTFDRSEGPHPFTISSAWKGDGRLVFHIKELGDYTTGLAKRLHTGDTAIVEGPYGCFDFESDAPAQIWVAGGIGITPFIARMQALADRNGEKSIDLFFSTNAPDESFLMNLQRLAEKAKVKLHVLVTRRDGYLTADRVRAAMTKDTPADVWFCGPAGLAASLRRDLNAQGFPAGHFHQEWFQMR